MGRLNNYPLRIFSGAATDYNYTREVYRDVNISICISSTNNLSVFESVFRWETWSEHGLYILYSKIHHFPYIHHPLFEVLEGWEKNSRNSERDERLKMNRYKLN